MIITEFRTVDLPVAERLDFFHDMADNAMIPTAISTEHTDDFRATMRTLDFGVTQVSALTYPSLETRRTPKLIRQSDPEFYQVSLTLRGHHRITQVGRDTVLGPGDLMFYDSSRPFHGWAIAATGDVMGTIVAQTPKAQFPLPLAKVDQLLAVRISGCEGIGALLAPFLAQLAQDAAQYRPADAVRLATVLFDLIVALLGHALDIGSSVPPESHRRTLNLRIQSFIRQHIGEPQLAPSMIAAAHHISTRHLHRLFQDQGTTVAAWIRSERLEGCHRDLADPTLCMTPIHEIATRWGFSHPAAFSRAFRGTYGLSPRDHRRSALVRQVAQG